MQTFSITISYHDDKNKTCGGVKNAYAKSSSNKGILSINSVVKKWNPKIM